MPKNKNEKKIKLRVIVGAFLAIILIYIIVIGVLLYGFGKHNSLIDQTAKYFPYPAAVVNHSSIVTVRELNDDLNSVRRFYESQDFSDVGLRVDFSTADGQKRLEIKERNLLNKLIENRIVEKLAADKGIIITKEMAAQNVQRELNQYGNGSEVEKNLASLYGWNLNDFEEKIVKPDMYRAELDKNRQANDANFIQAKAKITQAQQEINAGKDFAEVASKYSEGESAKKGGDLGWFTADQMMPEIATAAFIMKKGDHSDIIESSIGFHIIQVDDKKTEDGIDTIKIRQILVRTKGFADWLLEQEKNIGVNLWLKDYYWNKETATVEFKNAELKDFENNLDKNSAGDVSLIF
jgi:parvulin-like peptidyl-prolyl isomerase